MSWAKSLKKQLFKEEKPAEEEKPKVNEDGEEIELSEDEKELQDIDKKIGSLEVTYMKIMYLLMFFEWFMRVYKNILF
jgi:hypothetical protein